MDTNFKTFIGLKKRLLWAYKLRLILVLSILLSSLDHSSIAQKLDVPVIEVDSISRAATDVIPFDRKFILKIRTNENPPFVEYIQNKKNFAWYVTVRKKLQHHPNFQFKKILQQNINFRKENGLTYLFITFDKHPFDAKDNPKDNKNDFLAPSKFYSILVPGLYDRAIEVFDALYKHDNNDAEKIINELSALQRANFDDLNYFITNLDSASKFFQDFLLLDYQKIERQNDTLNLSSKNFQYIQALHNSNLLPEIIKQMSISNRKFLVADTVFNSPLLLKSTLFIYYLDMNLFGKVLRGELTFIDAKAENDITIEDKIHNLNTSLNILSLLENYIHTLYIESRISDPQNLIEYIKNLKIQLSSQMTLLEKIKDSKLKMRKKIIAKQYFLEPLIVSGSSNIYDFKARSKLQIIPDFGYVGYGFQKNFTAFVPFIGFQICFRPIDKNIPFNVYPNKTIWHHLSFTSGWTLAGVAKTGQRENFFSNSSFMTGLGYKFTNAVRLVAGYLWFYEDSPNPIKDDRKLTTTLFAGLSIDIDVKEFLNDFASLKPNLK